MAIVTSIGPRIQIPLAGLMQLSPNMAQPASPDQVARHEKVMQDFKLHDPAGFEERQAAMERRTAVNRELREKARDVQVHTVFRKEGRIVALQWQDGRIEVSDPSAAQAWSRTGTVTQDSGLTREHTVDAYAAEFERNLGQGITAERYAGRADAPTRRDYEMGRLFTEADLRAGRRVDITA